MTARVWRSSSPLPLQGASRTVGIYPEAKHPTWHNHLPALVGAGLRMEEILLAALHRRGYSGPPGSEAWLARPSYIQCFEPTSLEYMSTKSSVPLVLLLGGWAGYVTPDTGVTLEEVLPRLSTRRLAALPAAGQLPCGPVRAAIHLDAALICMLAAVLRARPPVKQLPCTRAGNSLQQRSHQGCMWDVGATQPTAR
jgi:glycerophosphoryl diester phosphodiesterase